MFRSYDHHQAENILIARIAQLTTDPLFYNRAGADFLEVSPVNSHSAYYFTAPNPNSYGRALMSVPPQAIAPNPHTNLLNVYIQLANEMGFQKKKTR
jgi:hypothetical protein